MSTQLSGQDTLLGVLDQGNLQLGVKCIGEGADSTPDGWCVSVLSTVWVERWTDGVVTRDQSSGVLGGPQPP
ncbi:MAG: hypothetical protein HN348_32340 [Proteobacteria bacterium]|nr:hypothetical protein [Pseudomonadota bacterium]